MQQEIVGRLRSRNPLLDRQAQAVMSAVARAGADGTLGVSTSRPEAWARDLVDRVQFGLLGRIGELTESERERESSDLERLVDLLERLGRLGYL